VSNVPSVNGNNEISGITLIGNNSNNAISSKGRNNQKIHDNYFKDFVIWLKIRGKDPVWRNDCTTNETATATYCDNNKMLSIFPASTDWATGAEIHHNTVTNAKLYAHTIAGAKIHHNIINNTKQDRSGVGHTSYWWSAVDFSYNEIHMLNNKWANIAVEVWEIQNDSKFHDNKIDGWVSLLMNTKGINTPYSYEIYNNDFSSNIINGGISEALELSSYVSNVRIANNYFCNTGSNQTYKRGIGIWGLGPIKEILISNNVFYNINGTAIEINSTLYTGADRAVIDNVYIYNNVFDKMQAGTSSAVLLSNDGSSGDIHGIFIKNNIITNASYGVDFWPFPPKTMSGNVYSHNVITQATGHVRDRGSSTFTIGTAYKFVPAILASGDRWKDYYQPNGSTSNLIGQGTPVGLPYSGKAPDIGPYQFYGQPTSPTGLKLQ